ncbi:unnamed protein product [Lupinus luteus]|uniref:NAD(P)-binding domain-containing protein n=1 Tax=Lupinus luteus TaxID=3873 RepID=A0AAV1VRH3_LUPLU
MGSHTPKNILIVGAAGFIASHVANKLVRSYPDYKMVVLDKLDYCSNMKNLIPSKPSPNFKFVKGDIGSAGLVNYLLITESIDTIMHCATQTHADNSFGNSFEFTKNIIYGTHVLLEACEVNGQIRKFSQVSTDGVYGETNEDNNSARGDIGSADLVNYLLITESIDTIMHYATQTHKVPDMGSHTPKNILIVGAAGFIASHVANKLVRSYPD